MKRIYIAGAYSADNVMDVLKNIREGIKASIEIMKLGFSPFCPWLDYQFVFMDFDNKLELEDFYRYSIDWLEVSDAIIVIGKNWQDFKGVNMEIDFAIQRYIPIFYGIDEFKAKLNL